MRLLSFCAVILFALAEWSCHLTPEEEQAFSFPTLADSLSEYDSAVIYIKSTSGTVLDTLFHGPVRRTTELKRLPAPHYDGGQVLIVIEGYQDGKATYLVEKAWDDDAGKVEEVTVIAAPFTTLRIDWNRPPLRVGDSLPLPRVEVHPSTLADTRLVWVSRDPLTLPISGTRLFASQEGTTRLVVSLRADSTKRDSVTVEILPRALDSLRFDPDTVELVAGGLAEPLSIRAYPPKPVPELEFSVEDRAIARVDQGMLRGLSAGETRVVARVKDDSAKSDTLRVIVAPAERVDSLVVSPDTLRLYLNGESRPLSAVLSPSAPSKRILWRTGNSGIAEVDGQGVVFPVGAGKAFITAISRSDSAKRDSALAIVRKDTPRIAVGGDTVVAIGQVLAFRPVVAQEYGVLAAFKWDLDGDGDFEGSSEAAGQYSRAYAEAGTYLARFYARDGEGNDTTVTKKIKVVSGMLVQITSPRNGSFTNEKNVEVAWTVDGASLKSSEELEEGANLVIRSSRDSAGNLYSDTITIHLDRAPPARPGVAGPLVPVNTRAPMWTWSGGGGGNGVFRYRLDSEDFTGAISLSDTFYVPVQPLGEGPHTLFVQERDEAGNWSQSGRHVIRIDTTRPPPPAVSAVEASPTRKRRPAWTWTGGPGDPYRFYRFKLDDMGFPAGATDTTGSGFAPGADLPEGPHTLYVWERDSAGNWSATPGSASITVDGTPPEAPKVSVSPSSPSNAANPVWTWSSGGGSGAGIFRYRLDTADLGSALEGAVLQYAGSGLNEGLHTLYVQERDAAGNWSATASSGMRIDRTPPPAPAFTATPVSPTQETRPTWTWASGTGDGAGIFRFRLDSADLSLATPSQAVSLTPSASLTEGLHNLYLQERDSAGNWSATVSSRVEIYLGIAVGAAGISQGAARFIALEMDKKSGKLYLAYADSALGYKVSVMSHSGTFWTAVGQPGFSAGQADNVKLALSPAGVPYVAFVDVADGKRVKVMRFNGSAWEPVGSQASAGSVGSLSFVLDGNGVPLVGYWDDGYPTGDGYFTGAASVMRFDGSNWVYVGRPGFSYNRAVDLSIVVDPQNVPIIVHNLGANALAMAFRFADTGWTPIGGQATLGRSSPSSFKCATDGSLFLAYRDDIDRTDGWGKVRTLSGNEWVDYGGQYFASERIRGVSMALDESGRPYVAYWPSAGTPPVVVKADQGGWKAMDPPAGSSVWANGNLSLTVSPGGVAYLAYSDGNKNSRATVVKFFP